MISERGNKKIKRQFNGRGQLENPPPTQNCLLEYLVKYLTLKNNEYSFD